MLVVYILRTLYIYRKLYHYTTKEASNNDNTGPPEANPPLETHPIAYVPVNPKKNCIFFRYILYYIGL